MTNIAFTLTHSHPSSEWTLDGDEYSGLTWISDTPKPTDQEITDAYPLAVAAKESAESEHLATITAARDHAATLGFTDAMLAVMYPQLLEARSE
jgi:hypothetical protein